LKSSRRFYGVTSRTSLHTVLETYRFFFIYFSSHPYNPLKSLAHEYAGSPTGEVTLNRSTVLALSGWSNTQFSYWVRRGEAISTLRDYDERLGALASVLERRLRDDIGAEIAAAHSDTSSSLEGQRSESPSSSNSAPTSGSASSHVRPEDDLVQGITGKGLDIIIDEVKKRSGVSQFLRGKHSSLDPFGTVCLESSSDNGGAYVSAPFYTPIFQAMEYTHSLPPSETKRKQKGRGKAKTHGNSEPAPGSSSFGPQANLQIDVGVPLTSSIVSDSCGLALPQASRSQAPTQSSFDAASMIPNPTMRSGHAAAMFSHNAQNPGHHPKPVVKEAVHPSVRRELFPVSDSRSELENVPQGFKRNGEMAESPHKKRTRQQSEVVQ
jgi:hypothetical protein